MCQNDSFTSFNIALAQEFSFVMMENLPCNVQSNHGQDRLVFLHFFLVPEGSNPVLGEPIAPGGVGVDKAA